MAVVNKTNYPVWQAADEVWNDPTFSDLHRDCHGYLRQVAAKAGVPLPKAASANELVRLLKTDPDWQYLGQNQAGQAQAKAYAARGYFVIAGLEDYKPPPGKSPHGHVVVVIPSDPDDRSLYPRGYWGMYGGVGKPHEHISWAWIASAEKWRGPKAMKEHPHKKEDPVPITQVLYFARLPAAK